MPADQFVIDSATYMCGVHTCVSVSVHVCVIRGLYMHDMTSRICMHAEY